MVELTQPWLHHVVLVQHEAHCSPWTDISNAHLQHRIDLFFALFPFQPWVLTMRAEL